MNKLYSILSVLGIIVTLCLQPVPARTITGRVVDSLYGTPAPLESVLVQLRGTPDQAYTDSQGYFSLSTAGISDRVPGQPVGAVRCTGPTLQWESRGPSRVTIYAGDGTACAGSRVPAGTCSYEFPALRDGVYIVKLKTGGRCWAGRLVAVNTYRNVETIGVSDLIQRKQGKAAGMADTLVLARTKIPQYAQKSIAVGAGDSAVTVSLSLHFPDSTATGWQHTGMTLKPWTQSNTFEGTPWNNHVFDGFDFTGTVNVRANNLTFRRCRFRAGGEGAGINATSRTRGLVIEDCEFSSLDNPDLRSQRMDRAINLGGLSDVVIRRTWCHHMIRGIAVDGCNGVVIEDCVVGPNYNPPVDAGGNANFSLGCGQERNHSTVVKSNGGASNITIRNNTLVIAECSCASSISSFYPETNMGGPNHNITFEGNLLINQGAAMIFYCGYTPPGESPNTNFIYRHNWVSTLDGTYRAGVTDHWNDGRGPSPRTWEFNRWYDLQPTGGGYTSKYGQTVNP